MHRLALGTMVGAALLSMAPARPNGPAIAYPEGYRRFAHVRSAVVTAHSPSFAVSGGIHHIYANPLAVEGYAAGKFADGSLLVFDRLAVTERAGVYTEAERLAVDVMVKDAARFAETGGWGFEEFAAGNPTDRRIGERAQAACWSCHARQRDHDGVFSRLRD